MKKLKALTSVVTAVTLAISGFCFTPQPEEIFAADICVVDSATQYQTIRGFGGMNYPQWVGSDLTPAQIQTAFGNGTNELGFEILRIHVDADPNQWKTDVATAKAVLASGGIVFATPWVPPTSMQENTTSSQYAGEIHLKKSSYAAYAQHLNDFIAYMKDNGVPLAGISIQNEPDYAEKWCWWTPEELTDFLATYGSTINAPLISPEAFQYGEWNNKVLYNTILSNAKATAAVDIWGTHFYGTSRAKMDFPALENSGKEIWMTEVYVPNSDADSNERYPEALQVSENIHNGLVVGNMSAYVWWYIRRNYGPMNEDGTISKRGYCMAQYSKFVRSGAKRIAATEQPADDVFVSAYKNTDGTIAIVAINKGSETYSQNFSLGSAIDNVDRYRTSANENLALTSDLETTDNTFWASLPGESVSTFVVDLAEGSGNNGGNTGGNTGNTGDTDVTGTLFHDTFEDEVAWAAHGGAEVTLSGRSPYAGTNALLVQARDASWCGVEKTLNTSTFVPGKAYSFSVLVQYLEGSATNDFALTLQYTDTDGEVQFARIASASAVVGRYAQLANTSFTIPTGASDLIMYIETGEGTDNFYIDEAIGATDGTVINFTPPEIPEIDENDLAGYFSGITLGKSFKSNTENNPLNTQYFGADPGVMVYNDRVYVYMTNDTYIYNTDGTIGENTYGQIKALRCISSDDMVNWTDHGLIQVAGSGAASSWASNSWAPTATHKTINGKEKFFIYYANNGNGIGVLSADSPTGPFTSPISGGLITRSTPNCGNVTWLFDPAVFVDDDGTGYIYFGGGIPDGQQANPGTARVAQLGDDMISIVGTPVTINPPYLFEDSGINKIGDKYYYSYCSNFNTGGNNLGITNAAINYMVSDSPMGPFNYVGEFFKGIGSFFGSGGNNHHTVIEFKGEYYLYSQTQVLQDAMGVKGGYRSTHVDKVTFSNGKFGNVTGTKTGVPQIKDLDTAFTGTQAETMANQAGIEIEGVGDTTVKAGRGDWFKVAGVATGNNTKSISVTAAAPSGGVIRISKGSATGDVVAYIGVETGGMQEFTAEVTGLNGTQDLFFVFSDAIYMDKWSLSETEKSPDVLIGDVDGDKVAGKTNDIVLLAKYLNSSIKLNSTALIAANCDTTSNSIDTSDLSALVGYLLGTFKTLPYSG
ncbi:MAG: family 43 glycosylhydrolase [Oscillospiraceae bacterium]|jgi:glucuronoarabinoxylan endo-1,4-beta-xylanase|nr:family 43 glycosylhydrolase [Oscillospiraceae bacterium]